ncbi:MAG TPA: MBL fold metallo-hydrolase [Propionibacteriaceae bacterium]|nr:MBL fold metallo-hydrolase [Propionibacteriaceae bacterium]
MKLTIVGCSGSASGPDSAASSYLIQAPHGGRTYSLVLDLGPGAFGALYRHLNPSEVDAVGLTHLHPDHCLDLCGFHVAARYGADAPWPRRPLYGPVDTAARLTRAYEVTGPDAAAEGASLANSFDFRTWQAEQQIGPFHVRTVQVSHPVETYAIRVEERSSGRSLVYSGDTGPDQKLVDLARDVDLLLVESAYLDVPNNPPDLHLNGREAAECARAAGAGEVILTHIPPWHRPSAVLAEAAPHFAGPITLAVPGASWDVGGSA